MRIKHIAIVVVALFATFTALSLPQESNEPIHTITTAFQKGSASEVAKHFSPTIEMMLFEQENMYSKSQAELLLKDFFSKNKPSSFKINHQGAKGNTSFAIGTLLTSSGAYRVSIFLKKESANTLIHQLRIEPSE